MAKAPKQKRIKKPEYKPSGELEKGGEGQQGYEGEQKDELRHSSFVDPRKAPVPKPDLSQLTPMTTGRHPYRSWEQQEALIIRQGKHVAKSWLKYAPTFLVKGVDLPSLSSRPKNRVKDKENAQAVADELECNGVEPDACSARFVDRFGNVLACVFAHRLAPEKPQKISGKPMPYPGSQGRTLMDVVSAPKQRKFYDGLPELPSISYLEATQDLNVHLPPVVNKRDLRHPDESTMQYVEDGDPPILRYERAGVAHLVHAWHQQGHLNTPMTMSKDMIGRNTTNGAHAVGRYFQATRPIALYLKELFRVSYPEYFKKYEAAFQAGRWMETDPGPWLGRAVVWKLQVDIHMDGRDEGPTAIFNLGDYTGGILYLTDLGLKISYRPRDVVIFLSGRLYHSVSEWKAGLAKKGDKLTPGRVSTVFFFPEASYKELKGKKSGWMKNTQGGSSFNACESRK